MLFVGDDWAEDHHDVEVVNDDGRRLAAKRFPEGVSGLAGLHALIADHLPDDADPADVVIGIETDRGPWVQALIAAGYTVYAVNPLQAARYRERHGTSGSKSDPVTRTCWPSWCGWTGRITGRLPGTATPPNTSRCWPGRIRA